MTDTFLASMVAAMLAGLLLFAAAAAGIVGVVRTRRATDAGMAALKIVAGSSMEQLRSMSVEELMALDRRVAGLSASGVIALAFTMSLASRRIATALDGRTAEA